MIAMLEAIVISYMALLILFIAYILVIDWLNKNGRPHFENHPDGYLYVENKVVYKVHSKEHYYEILRKWGHYGRK